MKKIISLMSILLVITIVSGSVAAMPGYTKPSKPIKVFIYSKEVKLGLPILMNNGRALYPFREILEAAGITVSWNDAKKQAEGTYKDKTVCFPNNSATYILNGISKKMDTKTIIDPSVGRTYIPIRYAFESLGFDVQWVECETSDQIRISNLGPYSLISDQEFLDKYYKEDLLTTEYFDFDMVNKRILFKVLTGIKYPPLDTKLNPNINRQVYDLVKTLASDSEYLYVYYRPEISDLYSDIQIKYGTTETAVRNDYSCFSYCFFDKVPLGDKTIILLQLGKLWRDNKDIWSTPYFEKKLKDSLIAVFGQIDGINIYKYVFEKYLQQRNSKEKSFNITESVKFGKVKVDYSVENNALLNFYFSYIK